MDTNSVPERLTPQQIRRIVRPQDTATTTNSVLSSFIRSSQPWSHERVPLPGRLRWALWTLIPVELFWVIWLATIVTGATSCRGPICTVATLDHAAALLACGVFSVVGLAGLLPLTRGFSKCNGKEVVGLALTSAAGGTSLLGIGALVIGALIGLSVLATFVLSFTATPRREIDDARPRTPFPIPTSRGANPSRAHRIERPDQTEVAKPPPTTLVGVDRDSPGFY
jgi:hypothetical protein